MSGFKIKSSLKLALGAEINRRKAEDAEKPTASTSSRSKRIAPPPQSNKGIKKRLAADLASQPTAEELAQSHQRKTALQKKAELYERLQKGDTAGLTEAQRNSLGVDFEKKVQQEWDRRDEESSEQEEEEQSDGSDTDDEEPNPDRPRVEVTDDLGRTRYVRPSRAHKYRNQHSTQPQQPDQQHTDEADYADYSQAIYGAQTSFPIYEPSPEELRARHEALREEPLWKHYDPNSEVRDRGGASYKFSADEEERRKQQEAIKNARNVTEAEAAAAQAAQQADKDKLDRRRAEMAERKRKLLEARERQEKAKKARTGGDSGPSAS